MIPALEWQAQRISEFERMHPNVRVRREIDPGADKLRLAFASRTAPDVFFVGVDSEVMRFAEMGFLEPIDDFLRPGDRADIWESTLAMGRRGDRHYLWPLYNHALVILINESLCEERGVANLLPREDENWDTETFLRVARSVTFDRDGDGRNDVYGLGLYALGDMHYFMTTWLVNFGTRIFDPSRGFVFHSKETAEGLRFLRGLTAPEGVAPPGAAGYRLMDAADLFFAQKVGMMLGTAGLTDYGAMQIKNGRVKPFRWRLAPIPVATRGQPSVSYLTVGAVAVSRQTDPAKREAAMALARYVTSPELNRWFWAKWASPRRSTPLSSDPNIRTMMKLVKNADNFLLPPLALNPRYDLQRQLDLFYQRVFSSDVKIETALAEFEQKFNRDALKGVKNWPGVVAARVEGGDVNRDPARAALDARGYNQ
jgi:multiple sugar transport system substrate-binding protein